MNNKINDLEEVLNRAQEKDRNGQTFEKEEFLEAIYQKNKYIKALLESARFIRVLGNELFQEGLKIVTMKISPDEAVWIEEQFFHAPPFQKWQKHALKRTKNLINQGDKNGFYIKQSRIVDTDSRKDFPW